MLTSSLSAPPPGSTVPGDLYVDLQTRTMWLGVNPSVDPAEAVLLSDIMAIQDGLDGAVLEANAYTDQEILTRAPTVHQHVTTDITDFAAGVIGVINSQPGAKGFVKNMCVLYSGSMADIGVGDLAGWALCDGSQGTPDLRDRFILGAGNKANNAKNDSTGLVTNLAGAHKHNNTPVALTIAQLPAHAHSATLSGSGSGGTDNQGQHTHTDTLRFGTGTGSGNGIVGNNNGPDADFINPAGLHAHNVSVNVTVGGNTNNTGSNATHTHDMDNAPDHLHSVTLTNLRESIPYYALAVIMKL